MEKWLKENGREIVTVIIEGSIITVVAIVSGKRKAKCLLWVGGAELLRLVVNKYFNKFSMCK